MIRASVPCIKNLRALKVLRMQTLSLKISEPWGDGDAQRDKESLVMEDGAFTD